MPMLPSGRQMAMNRRPSHELLSGGASPFNVQIAAENTLADEVMECYK